MEILEQAQRIIDCEIEGLVSIKANFVHGFRETVNTIIDALARRNKVVVTGMGKNLHIAEKISSTLASTGSTSVVLNPAQAMHGDLGILQQGDVLLVLSYSGESEEVLQLLPPARRLNVIIVGVTGNRESTLARHSDIVACVAVPREACPFNMAPTTSTTATLAWGDALAMVLLEVRGFKREDYAKLHPSGAIGRALLLQVADIMRRDARLACVSQEADVKTVLLAMTEARAGSAALVDGRGTLKGVFTDGDLRRHIGKHPDILHLPVSSFMTRNPITVRENELAVDVLNIFETHNIDDLIVVDADNRVIGAVDIQDLPKMKVL
ncbi:MAG TPA: KpsF/GutQ family sugar-phosphate isomerase [Verrucomicrobia bacterium]|nr:KpsF/GutQ family sugar-phosphate isomerase [Verrucomicrobiota bacterium]